MKKTKKWLSLVTLLLLGAFVIGVALPALASDKQPAAQGQNVQQRNATCVNNGQGNRYAGQKAQTMVKAIANISGKEVADVAAARQSGKSMQEIAKDYGVNEQELVDQVMAQNKERLQTRLDAGTITQEQYDACIDNMQERIKERLTRTTTGPANGAGGQRQGRGQGQCGGCPNPNQNQAQ